MVSSVDNNDRRQSGISILLVRKMTIKNIIHFSANVEKVSIPKNNKQNIVSSVGIDGSANPVIFKSSVRLLFGDLICCADVPIDRVAAPGNLDRSSSYGAPNKLLSKK